MITDKQIQEWAQLLTKLWHEESEEGGLLIERETLEQGIKHVLDDEAIKKINRAMSKPLMFGFIKEVGSFAVFDSTSAGVLIVGADSIAEMADAGMTVKEAVQIIAGHARKKEKGELS